MLLPTDTFTIVEPQNQAIGIYELHLHDRRIQKLWKGRSGRIVIGLWLELSLDDNCCRLFQIHVAR